MDHPLRSLLADAARGKMLPADGRVTVLPAAEGPVHAALVFTAHHVVVADVDEAEVRRALEGADDHLGAPMGPPFLSWLAGRTGSAPGSLDVVLVSEPEEGSDTTWVTQRHDLFEHPRVRRSVGYRSDVRVFTDRDERGVLVLGRGLAGRLEVAFEVDPAWRGLGLARAMLDVAPSLAPAGEPLFAQAAPGNAASLRALLAAGFRPIGGEVLFLKPGTP